MTLQSIISEIINAESAKRRALATLHTELGYSSGKALAEAILEATEGASRRTSNAQSKTPSAQPKRRGRGLNPEHKQSIADALKAGANGTQVARDFGVSYPTVHEIKKSLGLVQARAASNKGGRKKRSS